MSLLGTFLMTWCMVVMLTESAGRSAGYSRTGSPEVGRLVQSYDERTDHRRPHELGFGYYYQGDIMLPEEQQDVERVSFSDKYPTTVWPNAIVPYYFEPGTFKPNEIYVIERSMEELQRQTCVRFIPRNPQTKHYVHITNRHAGCFASLGRQEDNSQNILNLQTPGCLFGGTPVHELMHTLGFLHEVSRADRDEYIYIDRSALRPEYQTDSFFATNFGKDVDGITTTYNISYNYGSIMHYSKTAGSRDGRQQVLYNLTEYDKPDFGSNHAIPSDIQAIKYRYCNGTIDRASIFSTLPFYPKPN